MLKNDLKLTSLKIFSAVSLREFLQLSHLSYLKRQRALELEPLELRRLKFDLIQYYLLGPQQSHLY